VTAAEVATVADRGADAGMRRFGLVILLVLAHLATTLTVPSARAAKAFGTPASSSAVSIADPAAHRGKAPTNICRLGAGLLACPYFAPAQPTAALPVEGHATAYPQPAQRLPSGRTVPTPLRPPRLSA
jgi:hypothetical protein